MLGFLFGFNARLGRLHFFVAVFAFAIAMTILTFAIVWQQVNTSGSRSAGNDILLPLVIIVPISLIGTAILYSMRIRDIGLNPVFVIPLWVIFTVCDGLLSPYFPQLAVDDTLSGTVVGSLFNIIAALALLFWTGTDADMPHPSTIRKIPSFPQKIAADTVASTPPASRFDTQRRPGSFGRLGNP